MGRRETRWKLVGGMSLARRMFVYWTPVVGVALVVVVIWLDVLDLTRAGIDFRFQTLTSTLMPIAYALQLPGVFFRLSRRPFVKMAQRRIRVKGFRTSFSDIDTVMVEHWRDGGATHVYLQFGKIGKDLAKVLLRSPSRRILNSEDRHLIVEILRQCNVRLPQRPGPDSTDWDRVNWVNRPHYLDRDQAIAYVLNTPPAGELPPAPALEERAPTTSIVARAELTSPHPSR